MINELVALVGKIGRWEKEIKGIRVELQNQLYKLVDVFKGFLNEKAIIIYLKRPVYLKRYGMAVVKIGLRPSDIELYSKSYGPKDIIINITSIDDMVEFLREENLGELIREVERSYRDQYNKRKEELIKLLDAVKAVLATIGD